MRNYTSSVPASRSIENIERLLANLGCKSISRDFTEKRVSGFYFQLEIKGKDFMFRLPAKADLIYKRLAKGKALRTEKQIADLKAQADRTAWKTLYELIQIQTDLILLEQSDALEAFLPYVFDGQMTLRERLDTEGGLKMLNAPADSAEYEVIAG